MSESPQIAPYLQPIVDAFADDGYDVIATFEYEGARGVSARHKTALNCGGPEKKAAYYIEGTPYQMGYLMGRIAESSVAAMAIDFTAKCLPAFVNPNLVPERFEFVFKWLVDMIDKADAAMREDLPPYLLDEMQGLVDGCKAANPSTKVDFAHIFTLNVAVDYLSTLAYAPNQIWHEHHGITSDDLNVPVFCNSFSAWNGATKSGDGFFFGRDFMFPSSGVFQFQAAHIVRVPHETSESGHPFVSVSAPGWVGSVAAMNAAGIAAGVDMVPAACVDHSRPGFNSLCLVRDAIEHCASADAVVERMVAAHRGCSWLYPVADAAHDTARVIESGFTTDALDPLQYPPKKFLVGLLPTAAQLAEHETIPQQQGLMARGPGYEVPDFFLNLNKALFVANDKPYEAGVFDTFGTPGDNVSGPDFPGALFFPKANLPFDDVIATCNSYIIPTMRLTSTNKWTQLIGGPNWNDFQWRYDALTWLLREHHGAIDADLARKIIDFLGPQGFYPNYYKHEWPGDDPDWKTQVIQGSTSLFDLRAKTVTTHWGLFGDEWASLDLMKYLGL